METFLTAAGSIIGILVLFLGVPWLMANFLIWVTGHRTPRPKPCGECCKRMGKGKYCPRCGCESQHSWVERYAVGMKCFYRRCVECKTKQKREHDDEPWETIQ